MNTIRLGILGATRGIDFALALKKLDLNAEVTAVCDCFAPLLDKVREALPPHGLDPACFTDFDAMLTSGGVDAVVIANNANAHAPFAIRALTAGKHVLSEVQPVQTPSEAAALCDAAEQSGKVYRYAENYCTFRNNLELIRSFRRGDIGELVSAESDFINDCSGRWHLLTRGQRNHWRNLVPSTFYCTHSLGPLLAATEVRPVRVTGFETKCENYMRVHGARSGSAAMEILETADGVFMKSLHGNLKRPWQSRVRITGTEGTLEAQDGTLVRYTENAEKTGFLREVVDLTPPLDGFPEICTNHADALTLAGFLGAIRGDRVMGQYGIDVYRALDMALPGLYAYRSILTGNLPQKLPDLRDPADRAVCREDTACTDPESARGDALLPSYSRGEIVTPDAVYEAEAAKLKEAMDRNFHLGMN